LPPHQNSIPSPAIAFLALLLTPTDRQSSQDASAFIKALHGVRSAFG
jgi:hypothetical protein